MRFVAPRSVGVLASRVRFALDSRARARITAVICTRDGYDGLEQTIGSLLDQSLPRERYRIIVVDNSDDPARARAFAARHRRTSGLRVLREPRTGLSHARNRGLAACRTPLIAFTDDDTIPARDWLERLAAAFDRFGPRAAVVGGRIVARWQGPRPAWLTDGLLGYYGIVDWGGAARTAAVGEWLAGANIAFRTGHLRRAGGFDPRLGRHGDLLLGNEEIAVTNWLRNRRRLVVYEPAAVVEHNITQSRLAVSWLRKRVAWQAVSDYLMVPGWASAEAARLDGAGESPDFATVEEEMRAVYRQTMRDLAGHA
jgi:glycosyltransferase involved in cell wall biosynthesis